MKYWDKALGWVHGCSPVSQGCLHCWAAGEAYVRSHQKNPKIRALYEGLTELKDGIPTFNVTVRINEKALEIPLKTKKPTVFAVAWGGDLFHEAVPLNFQAHAFSVMASCPEHTFLVLTKRPQIMAQFIKPYIDAKAIIFRNIYLGTTVESPDYLWRVEELLKCTPFSLWLSIEPMLGPIDLRWGSISQVILGGETGPGARPMHPEWVRSVRDQCKRAGVPFFFKGWGSPKTAFYMGLLLDGQEHNELVWRVP